MTRSPAVPLLLVDDQELVLGLIARWLSDEGYEIVTCSRYDDARRYLADHTPSALVTDVRLGAYNGLQLAMLLHDREPDVPLIVLSAFDDPVVKEETKRLGGVFLVKPLEREAFLSALREKTSRRN